MPRSRLKLASTSGNRLGGNAITEIFVSGRIAAKAVTADNE